jgi:hypothetical protein
MVCVVSAAAPLFEDMGVGVANIGKYHSHYELHVVIYDSMFYMDLPQVLYKLVRKFRAFRRGFTYGLF